MPKDNQGKDSVKMTLPAKMAYLPIVTEAVRQYAATVGFPEEDIHKIVLSVEETVVNIIHHSFVDQEASPSFDISLDIIRNPYGLSIRINDKGIPFDPSRQPVYYLKKDWADQDISGLGLKLIQGMMDRVEYRNLGRKGKEALLIKYCVRPDQDGNHPDVASMENIHDSEEIQGPIEYIVRRISPDEAVEVSRGAYKSHGYTFFDDVIYYPEKIRDLNEKDLMISAVAVSRRREIMGHGALLLSDPNAPTADIDFLFVDPKFRKQTRLGSQITEYLMKTAREKNLVGVYAYTVTVHTISQKMAAKAGLQPLSILLAASPMTWNFKGITEQVNQRISVVLGFKYLQTPQPRVIYLPERHETMIRRLYGSLHAGHRFEKAQSAPVEALPAKSVLRTEIAEVENSAGISIVQVGNDLVAAVRAELRKLCVKDIDSIALGVSLEDGTAARYLDRFEEMGFFFAGVFPETPIGDALVLQYLNNLEFDYASVNILPGDSQELLDYILRCDPNQDL